MRKEDSNVLQGVAYIIYISLATYCGLVAVVSDPNTILVQVLVLSLPFWLYWLDINYSELKKLISAEYFLCCLMLGQRCRRWFNIRDLVGLTSTGCWVVL